MIVLVGTLYAKGLDSIPVGYVREPGFNSIETANKRGFQLKDYYAKDGVSLHFKAKEIEFERTQTSSSSKHVVCTTDYMYGVALCPTCGQVIDPKTGCQSC